MLQLTFVKGVFQVVQAHHRPGRFAGTAFLGIEGTELLIEDHPVDTIGQDKHLWDAYQMNDLLAVRSGNNPRIRSSIA
ncbi:hypothetical protein EDC39_11256 [Geothermobacter ehrlichii]|uniref:Uncharacterized protein n=1 Tax=Geothermobacter ehrlichii TaxID=213224 RepID=A0A5D3WI61_9BACT|nr:hypothetical protein EDC39_11256 [Geothermobacter ehrlichii]